MKNLSLKHWFFLLLFPSQILFAQSGLQQAGYYRTMVGDVEVIALSDGTVPVDAHMLLGKVPNVDTLLHHAYLKQIVETSINAYLINTGRRHILVDAGAGDLFGGTYGGALIQSLRNAGYETAQITDILITHIHLDHTGGLLVNNKMVFPKATIHVSKADIDFWLQHQEPKVAEARGITANRAAFMALKPYLDAGNVHTFEGASALFEGINTLEASGHTAGHTLFVLENNGDKMVFWGDLVHISPVQLAMPDNPDEYDFDKDKAAKQRVMLYREAAEKKYMVAADHISFPGIGRLRKKGLAYEWIPLNYSVQRTTK
ncbi:MBL fold metallo-hydrolase [Chitinophaga ginsengisoli]|uniref:Glyoxylase-like metal-dependent hydrolase (Beta-lactamase superfamily II) n=1 Tax=Chitinophaga ginsengisoli TaxID=363837 RepID=A0A2P8GE79_9BACT|nr:MBL fold metallo-hydrolase [Chitinophaga ginsengisoli]PSL32284.1 glyoxylase-like metal-dependent hydrolase (beta-lactamase superfamily II) [Chitinophaga ginsengisoli]